MNPRKSGVLLALLVLPIILFVVAEHYYLTPAIAPSSAQMASDPVISSMISMISESEIYTTVYQLQSFLTRVYGYSGNTEAGTYLYNRLDDIAGLNVEYEGGSLRNIVATLPGVDGTSNAIYMVGAHYDSYSSVPTDAPGATDNGGGVAIVLEFARIMSQYRFRHTLKFALWNREENGLVGSMNYAGNAYATSENISLYFNYDSSCYDPDNRLILDIMYNSKSQWVSDMMSDLNTLYSIDFMLTYNVHGCGSDHRSFWQYGYTSVMTHEEIHGPAHTPDDTVDKVSLSYAKKNAQLGMSVLAELAETQEMESHDIALRNLSVSKTAIVEGETVGISVIVHNEGTFEETFSLAFKVYSTIIETRIITLQSHDYTTAVSSWNTLGYSKGLYSVVASVTPVLNETDDSDNTLALGVVITIVGDVNGDHYVDMRDLGSMGRAYATHEGDMLFDANCDLDGDKNVDMYDLGRAARNYMESW